MKLAWFRREKPQKNQDVIDDMLTKAVDSENADLQGSYTDYSDSTGAGAYLQRMTYSPFYGDELEAFESIMDKYMKRGKKQSDAIEDAIDDGWLEIDKEGMLRVADEEPE